MGCCLTLSMLYYCVQIVSEPGAGGLLSHPLYAMLLCIVGELGACALAAVSPSLCYVTVYSW